MNIQDCRRKESLKCFRITKDTPKVEVVRELEPQLEKFLFSESAEIYEHDNYFSIYAYGFEFVFFYDVWYVFYNGNSFRTYTDEEFYKDFELV